MRLFEPGWELCIEYVEQTSSGGVRVGVVGIVVQCGDCEVDEADESRPGQLVVVTSFD